MLSSVVFWGLIALIGTSRGSYPFTHSMNPHLHPRLYHGCYGDIMTMKTSGATCDANSVMRCLDKQKYPPVGTWDSKEHLSQAAGILTDGIKAIQKKFPMWSVAQHLKGGLSAFKSGVEEIATLADIDNDFVNDIVARAKFYKRQSF
uniref:Lysozyme g2 n=1 Tax=Cebus imitator TaxID=2715852 RepID=A0A2K5PYB9_CEBIM